MVQLNNEIRETLNKLTEICRDGENGYKAAAEKVEDVDLKRLFKQYSHQRSIFLKELQTIMGGEGVSGFFPEASQQGWMNVTASLPRPSDTAIIIECERGEDQAIDAYDKALEKEFPQKIRNIIARQSKEVHKIHDRVRALEKSNLF